MGEEIKNNQDYLHFLESLDTINHAIRRASDLQQMMRNVLDAVLSIFDCDRAFLMYPCDPEAVTWRVPMERNRPEYPGVLELGLEMPMDADVAETLRLLLASDGPVKFGPGTPYPLPTDASDHFGFKCFMSMALYPKAGKPWQFGVHQCSYARSWTKEEERLFQEIGRRLTDGLASLLVHQYLLESEKRYRLVFENSPVSIWEEDFSAVKTLFDNLKKQGVTDIEAYFDQHPEMIRHCAESAKIVGVNRAALALHGAATEEELLAGLVNTFTPESFDTFRRELICLWNGETDAATDAVVKTLSGELRDVTIYFSVSPGYEKTLSKVFVSIIDITERKRAEEALNRANRQLRAISTCNKVLMQASDELTLLNEICRIVCEEAGYRMAWVGYPQNDEMKTIRPMAWAGAEEDYLASVEFTWAVTEHGRDLAGQAISGGSSACMQNFAVDLHAAPWRESAMQRGYCSGIALPLKDESGTPFGALSIYSAQPGTFTLEEKTLLDELAENLAFGITTLRMRAEHIKAEMRILDSEQLFRALVENSPDFIARYDRECCRIYANPAIQKLFGGQVENVLDKTPADQSPLYAPQEYIDHLRQAVETATESTAEILYRTIQGEIHWGHIRFVPEFGPDGHVVSVLAIGRDVHEIKENEQRFRMLAENFPDFVARFDRTGHYTYVNPAVEKAFGLPAEAIIGKSLQELPQGRKKEQNDELLNLIHLAFDKGVANESEVYWDTEIGERIYEIRHAPEKDAAGSVVSVLSIARDISERKRLEDQLRQSQKMEAVGQLAGGVAHDFNNMLGVIIGYAELIASRENMDKTLLEHIEQILKAARQSGKITRQLLAFARKQTIAPITLDLNETVAGMLKLLKRLIGEDVDLTWLPGESLWPVKMDPSQIDQILANLCVNARDAIAGVGKITIETHKVEFDEAYCADHKGFHPGEFVMLAVSDNGSGMDRATLNKIFEPFFTTKELGRGTGLGLSTVYGIVKQNAGFINVYSELGHGSSFKVYLPRRHSVADGSTPMAIPDPQVLRGNETILVVEDDVSYLEISKLILEQFGYRVLTASTPSEALLAAKAHPGTIQLLLTDLIMPEMNGRELANQMTSLYPDIMCLFMSGYTGNVIAHHGILDEGIHFLQKPFAKQALAEKVRKILDGKQISAHTTQG